MRGRERVGSTSDDVAPGWHPPSSDVTQLLVGRGIRAFADGFVSVLLAPYLTELGFSPVEVGAIITGTLLGSALLTLAFWFTAHRFTLRTLLIAATALMAVTGLGSRRSPRTGRSC